MKPVPGMRLSAPETIKELSLVIALKLILRMGLLKKNEKKKKNNSDTLNKSIRRLADQTQGAGWWRF